VTAELVVGVTLPLSGSLSTQGDEVRRGLELWCRDAEVEGRKRIHLRIIDDGSSARRAAANVERLLEQNVDLLFGPYAGRAVAQVAGRPGVLMWNHSSSDDDVARPFVVTLPTPASKYLVGAVELAAERGCLQALVAVSDTRFGAAVARGAEPCARALGMDASVLYVTPRQWAARRSEILSYDALGNMVALCGALRDDIETVAALRDRGNGSSLIAAVGAGVQEFGRALGNRAEGVIGPSQWEPEDTSTDVGPRSSRMVAAYRDRHGSSPDYLAVQAWSCGVLAEEAMEQVGPKPEDLWSWAMRFDGRTAYGHFRLDAEGRQVGHRLRLVRWNARENRRLLA
jgi:branched-chain amino acid transport system substrate-binding protein